MIKLITFLGNPELKYAKTRHNAGWMIAKSLSGARGLEWKNKFNGVFSQLSIRNWTVYLLKPGKYMNRSGESVRSCMDYFGLVPDEYSLMPDYIVSFLQDVPTVWDDTRFIEGHPGRSVVIARKSGDKWYIAGINGTGEEIELSPDLSFLSDDTKAVLISDGPDRTFNKTVLENEAVRKPVLKLQPNGGFVIVTN